MPAAVAEPVKSDAAATPSATLATAPSATAAVAPAGAAASVGAVAAPAASATAAADTAKAAAAAPTRLLAEPEKPAEPAKAADAKAEPVKDAPPPQWTLKAPDGSPLSADDVKAAEDFAKANGLSQVQAEKLLEREATGRAAAVTARTQEANQIADTWLAEVKAHPELGGAKLEQTVASAKRALTALASPEERKLIAASPFANHPVLLGILSRAAAMLPTEDTVHRGGAAAGDTDPATAIYGDRKRR